MKDRNGSRFAQGGDSGGRMWKEFSCGKLYLERSVRKRVFQREYDEAVRKIAQSGKIPYPKDYAEQVKRYCENLPDGRLSGTGLLRNGRSYRRRYAPCFRYGLVAAGIACFLLMIVPTSADVYGHWERMVEMSAQEKASYVSDLNASAANGDSFSREWTESESKRLEKLTAAYEQGQKYPEGEIISVNAETEVQPDQVCFLAKSSTFYLPQQKLTDEQLLQFIDFQHKREYSLKESVADNGDSDEGLSAQNENVQAGISRSDAVKAGMEWIEEIYGKSVDAWKCSVKEEENVDAYRITFRENKTAEEYMAFVRKTSGRIVGLERTDNGIGEEMPEGQPAGSKKKLRKQYQKAKDLAGKLDGSQETASGYCEYLQDLDTELLPFGVISFWVVRPDGSGWKITYSLSNREYVKFNYFSDFAAQVGKNNISGLESSTRKKISVKFE